MIEVRLVGVRDHRAVVDVVGDAVAVDVAVAGIADAVVIEIGLVVVRHTRTIVGVVVHAVIVVVEVAGVAQSVVVQVLLARVRDAAAVVNVVGNAVVVLVSVAGVADAVMVDVGLGRVGHGRTIVERIQHAVAVHVGLAHVAQPIRIRVMLVRIGDQRTVVGGVGHAVIVVVVVAGVAHAVAVGVGLVVIGDIDAVVAGIAEGVAVGVFLAGVGHVAAVVDGRIHAVAIRVDNRRSDRHRQVDRHGQARDRVGDLHARRVGRHGGVQVLHRRADALRAVAEVPAERQTGVVGAQLVERVRAIKRHADRYAMQRVDLLVLIGDDDVRIQPRDVAALAEFNRQAVVRLARGDEAELIGPAAAAAAGEGVQPVGLVAQHGAGVAGQLERVGIDDHGHTESRRIHFVGVADADRAGGREVRCDECRIRIIEQEHAVLVGDGAGGRLPGPAQTERDLGQVVVGVREVGGGVRPLLGRFVKGLGLRMRPLGREPRGRSLRERMMRHFPELVRGMRIVNAGDDPLLEARIGDVHVHHVGMGHIHAAHVAVAEVVRGRPRVRSKRIGVAVCARHGHEPGIHVIQPVARQEVERQQVRAVGNPRRLALGQADGRRTVVGRAIAAEIELNQRTAGGVVGLVADDEVVVDDLAARRIDESKLGHQPRAPEERHDRAIGLVGDARDRQIALGGVPPARAGIGVGRPHRADRRIGRERERIARIAVVFAVLKLVQTVGLQNAVGEVCSGSLLLREPFAVVRQVGVHDHHAVARQRPVEVDAARLRRHARVAPEVEPLGVGECRRMIAGRILVEIGAAGRVKRIVQEGELRGDARLQQRGQVLHLQPGPVRRPRHGVVGSVGFLQDRRRVDPGSGHDVPDADGIVDDGAAVLAAAVLIVIV